MTVSEDKLREIRSRISQAQAQKTRAEVDLENANERKARALETLRDEFGVHNMDELESVQGELEKDLKDAMVEVTSALEKING